MQILTPFQVILLKLAALQLCLTTVIMAYQLYISVFQAIGLNLKQFGIHVTTGIDIHIVIGNIYITFGD